MIVRLVLFAIVFLLINASSAKADGKLGVVLAPSEIPSSEEFTVMVSASALEHQVERAVVIQFPENIKLLGAYASDEDGTDTISLDPFASVAAMFTHEKNHQTVAYSDHTGIFSNNYSAIIYIFHFRASTKASTAAFRICLVERADATSEPLPENPKSKQKKRHKIVMGTEWRVVAPGLGSDFSFAEPEAKRFSKSVRIVAGWNKTSRALVLEANNSVAHLRPDSVVSQIFAGEFAISFWLRTSSPMQTICRWHRSIGDSIAWLGTNALGQIIFSPNAGRSSDDTVLRSTNVVADGSWHHVMLVKNSILRMFLIDDGSSQDTLDLATDISHIDRFSIGAEHSHNNFSIDELSILQTSAIPTGDLTISVRDTGSMLAGLFHFDDFSHTASSSVALRKKIKINDSTEAITKIPIYFELDTNAIIAETSSPVLPDRAVLSLEQSTATKVGFSWYATSESGVKRYELQRRIGSFGEYEKTLDIKAKRSASVADEQSLLFRSSYSAIETLPAITRAIELYYRLAVIGTGDSVFTYTQPVKLEYGGERDVFVDQNQPNPFNPKTSISFRLMHSTTVAVMIYDIMGRQVATLVDDKLSAGKHTLEVDASQWPGGIYFYKVKTPHTIVTKRMTVAK